MSDISGLAVGRSRRVSGSITVARGRTRTVLVGDGGALEKDDQPEKDGEGEAMWRLKLRADFESEKGETVFASEVRLLLRTLGLNGADVVAGLAVAGVQKLLLRVLLPPDDEFVEEPDVLLLIFRSLLKTLMLLMGGLVELARMESGSRHICASGAA